MIVQKFGGIAMQTATNRQLCVQHVINGLKQHQKTAVVLSAIGRFPDAYATDTLQKLLSDKYESEESRDLISICGELISLAIFKELLLKQNIKNALCYGNKIGIVTDEIFGNANVITLQKERLLTQFKKANCLLIAGFQGMSINQTFTTLGRGGSDLSAIYVAKMLQAEKVIFYKDVQGVQDENGALFDKLSYDELQKICNIEKPLLHKTAVQLAKQWKIPLQIKSFLDDKKGTVIY